eukprot:Selendium_serpulae@DN5085_c0_g1_i1.p1
MSLILRAALRPSLQLQSLRGTAAAPSHLFDSLRCSSGGSFIDNVQPPPREFNPDGSPRKYRLNHKIHLHKYNWEDWYVRYEGVYHCIYEAVYAKSFPAWQAWLMQYPMWIQIPIFAGAILSVSLSIVYAHQMGVKPKRYTKEWRERSAELARIENCNPITRYLDRRRRERGINPLVEEYLWTHPYALQMGYNHSDPAYLREHAEDDS